MLQKLARIRFTTLAFVGLMGLAMQVTVAGSRPPAVRYEASAEAAVAQAPAAQAPSPIAMATTER